MSTEKDRGFSLLANILLAQPQLEPISRLLWLHGLQPNHNHGGEHTQCSNHVVEVYKHEVSLDIKIRTHMLKEQRQII